jgi:hypothetical protein
MARSCSGAGHAELAAAAEGGDDAAADDDEDGDGADCRSRDMFVIMRERWSEGASAS